MKFDKRELWDANFGLLEIGQVEFGRAVSPADYVDLFEIAYASNKVVCSAVFVRFLEKGDSHFCKLVFARTKIVHDLSTSRAELLVVIFLTSIGHFLILSLGQYVMISWNLSESPASLIIYTKVALKIVGSNRVLEATILAEASRWFYAKIEDMTACPWDIDHGSLCIDVSECMLTGVPKGIQELYTFKNNLINPCRLKFSRVLWFHVLFLLIKRINVRTMKRKFPFLILKLMSRYCHCAVFKIEAKATSFFRISTV